MLHIKVILLSGVLRVRSHIISHRSARSNAITATSRFQHVVVLFFMPLVGCLGGHESVLLYKHVSLALIDGLSPFIIFGFPLIILASRYAWGLFLTSMLSFLLFTIAADLGNQL